MAPPPTIDPERERRREIFWTQLLWGLLLGALASALIWIPGWRLFGLDSSGNMLAIVPLLKIAIAVACLVTRPKGFGAGLLLSIPIGAAIFFGSCLEHLR